MGNPVVHFEINSTNAERLQKFYADAFDWHVDANNPMKYGMVDTHGGAGINGGIGQTDDPDSTSVTIYVQVDDIDRALAKIEKLGGKTVMPKSEVPGGPTIAIFTDLDGHRVGLVTGM